MTQKVTIKTIARDLGISHMTVSRALSNSPKVKDETRRVVLQKAHELGYIKNAAATAMRGHKQTIIGLLLPNLVNEFYARFADGLARRLKLKSDHLQLIIHLTNDDPRLEKEALCKLNEIQAKSVILVPCPDPDIAPPKNFKDLEVIQLIRNQQLNIPSRSVLVDDRAAIMDAVIHLYEQGHEKIGFIGGQTLLSSGSERLLAFQSAVAKTGLNVSPKNIFTGPPTFENGFQAAETLILKKDISALVCGGVELSNGALNACLERGISMPEKLAFIGYGDPSYYQWMAGGISTIKIPITPMVDYTIQLLKEEPDAVPAHHRLKAVFIPRHSSLG